MDSTSKSHRPSAPAPPPLLATLAGRRRLAVSGHEAPRVARAATAFAMRTLRTGQGRWSRWNNPASFWPVRRSELTLASLGVPRTPEQTSAASSPPHQSAGAEAAPKVRGSVQPGTLKVAPALPSTVLPIPAPMGLARQPWQVTVQKTARIPDLPAIRPETPASERGQPAGGPIGRSSQPPARAPLPILRLQSGTPLPLALRGRFEHALGIDLGGVRIHTDRGAAETATHLGASAFTVGSNIFFAAGRFRPTSTEGLALLTHELIHVRQAGDRGAGGRHLAAPQVQTLERQAREVERTLVIDHGRDLANSPAWTSPVPLVMDRPEPSQPLAVAHDTPALILATTTRTSVVTPLRQAVTDLPPALPPAPRPSEGATAVSQAGAEAPDLEAMGERLASWLQRRERIERERAGVQRWR